LLLVSDAAELPHSLISGPEFDTGPSPENRGRSVTPTATTGEFMQLGYLPIRHRAMAHFYQVHQSRVNIREHQSRLQKQPVTEDICSLVIGQVAAFKRYIRLPAGHRLMWTGFLSTSGRISEQFLTQGYELILSYLPILIRNYTRHIHVKWVTCLHGMERPQVTERRDDLRI
jgi:hypothetical protein